MTPAHVIVTSAAPVFTYSPPESTTYPRPLALKHISEIRNAEITDLLSIIKLSMVQEKKLWKKMW